MSNVKWSGIEQWKYGLTADWYVSAKYGSDTDVDDVGLYDRDSNPDGWGGPKRPFKGVDVGFSEGSGVFVLDGGTYVVSVSFDQRTLVGDGDVVFTSKDVNISSSSYRMYNIKVLQLSNTDNGSFNMSFIDSKVVYCKIRGSEKNHNSQFISTSFPSQRMDDADNCTFLQCSGDVFIGMSSINNIFIDCHNMKFEFPSLRPTSDIIDYSIIIGTVKAYIEVNGKSADDPLTIEDFKADGQYFRKSFSEVDLFGNEEGSGATQEQLNEIFNNFFYPYIDDWQYLDLSLRPDVDDRVRYGGLNGHFIGALPVGHAFDMATLWNDHQDSANTSNVELNMNDHLILTDSANPGVFTTTEITLPNAVDETDVAAFYKNNVYDSDGVAVQRVDYEEDPSKDNTVEQRTVYSFRMKTASDDEEPLSDWKEYELDKAPTVDENGNSNLNDNFDVDTQQKQKIKRFIIEITLRGN